MEKLKMFKRSRLFLQTIIAVLITILSVTAIVNATTIGTNITTGGTLEVTGVSTLTGAATLASNLTVDTDTFYVGATANRVGVGTTTPFATFSIDTNTGDNAFVIGSSTATYLTVNTEGDLVVDGSTFVVDASGSKVGIGTSTPSVALSVTDTSGNGQLMLGYNNTNYANLTVSSGGDLTIVASGGDISFSDENLLTTGTLGAGATTITGQLTASTYLGVASTTPSAKLSVGVTAHATSATSTIDFAKPCFRMTTDNGTMLYYWPSVSSGVLGGWATSTTSCF